MTECEICGGKATMKAKIDGALLDVCEDCSGMGEKVKIPRRREKRQRPRDTMPDSSKYVDPKYPSRIKMEREKRDMKISDLASAIKEKSSVISRLERGTLSPSFDLARKLENFFDIKLILEYKEEDFSPGEEEGKSLTIGDVVDLGDLDD